MSKLFLNKFWIKFKKNEIIRTKTSKYSTNLSLQKFWAKKSNIKQKPAKINSTPCRILSKTANHLSILKILIEIFKIPARNAPRILIYYMEKLTHQQKQREKFRKKRKNFKRKRSSMKNIVDGGKQIFENNVLWTERTY